MKRWKVFKAGLMDRPMIWIGSDADARQWRREGFDVEEL